MTKVNNKQCCANFGIYLISFIRRRDMRNRNKAWRRNILMTVYTKLNCFNVIGNNVFDWETWQNKCWRNDVKKHFDLKSKVDENVKKQWKSSEWKNCIKKFNHLVQDFNAQADDNSHVDCFAKQLKNACDILTNWKLNHRSDTKRLCSHET